MLYISKGRLVKRRRKKVLVSLFGGRQVLNELETRLWLNGLNGFVEPLDDVEEKIARSLIKNGLAIGCEMDTGREHYFTLTKCILCTYKKKSCTLFYSKREKEVLLWLRYKGMRLSIEELIFLFEKKIAPTPERLKKGNEEEIRRLLYPSPIIIGNPLRNIMAVALCRDDVIGAVLSLIKKREIFLI